MRDIVRGAETLADRLIDTLFTQFPRIAILQMPETLIDGAFADIGIIMKRRRDR